MINKIKAYAELGEQLENMLGYRISDSDDCATQCIQYRELSVPQTSVISVTFGMIVTQRGCRHGGSPNSSYLLCKILRIQSDGRFEEDLTQH